MKKELMKGLNRKDHFIPAYAAVVSLRHVLRLFYSLMLMGLVTPVCQAQFVPYSQFDNTPLLTNPAAAVSRDYTELSVHYRRSRIANYDIPSVSLIHPFYRHRDGSRAGAVGATVIRQQAGPGGAYAVTGALATFAYSIHLSAKHHVSAAVQGGMVNKRLDLSRITTDNQFYAGAFDPSLSLGEDFSSSTVSRPVVSSGFCWTYADSSNVPQATLGVAFFNMNRPSYELTASAPAEPITFAITGEMLLLQRARTSVHPSFRYMSGAAPFANIGARVKYALANEDHAVSIGGWYKTTKALVAALQYNTTTFAVSASMDFSAATNTVANISNALEIGLTWRMKKQAGRNHRHTSSISSKMNDIPDSVGN